MKWIRYRREFTELLIYKELHEKQCANIIRINKGLVSWWGVGYILGQKINWFSTRLQDGNSKKKYSQEGNEDNVKKWKEEKD